MVPVVIIRMEPTGVVEVMFLREHLVWLVEAVPVVPVVPVVMQEMVMIALGTLLVVVHHGEAEGTVSLVLLVLKEVAIM